MNTSMQPGGALAKLQAAHAGTAVLTKTERGKIRAMLREQNARFPLALAPLPASEWPKFSRVPASEWPHQVWRSRALLVQIFKDAPGITRLSVARTDIDESGRWQDGLTWDELQQAKRDVGYGDRDAVEVYPKDADLVNVANMRHLWILDVPLPCVWRDGVLPERTAS